MDYDEIRAYLKPEIERVRALMTEALASDIDLLDRTNRSLLSNSGKFIRPVLALLMARTCSGGRIEEDTIKYAAAAELLHNATLLHDDVADNSMKRRGKPTVISLLGSRASVLLGDYWLVKAVIELLAADSGNARLYGYFSGTLSDLAEGEMFQLQKTFTCDTDEADYLRIIHHKTASLFETAALSAAVSVSATEAQKETAVLFAGRLGSAFQIKDDILDYVGEDIGKPLGQDLQEQKITMPLLGAFRNAGPDREAAVRAKLLEIPGHPEYQEEIVAFVQDYGGLDYAGRRLEDFVAEAEEALSHLPAGPDRDCLSDMVRFVAGRKR